MNQWLRNCTIKVRGYTICVTWKLGVGWSTYIDPNRFYCPDTVWGMGHQGLGAAMLSVEWCAERWEILEYRSKIIGGYHEQYDCPGAFY